MSISLVRRSAAIAAALAFGSVLTFTLPTIANADAASAASPCDHGDTVTPVLTATQHITEPDSGSHGDWANDSFTEDVTVWMGTDNTTFCAKGVTTDGTFTTTGPSSPQNGVTLPAGITGTFTGSETWVLPAGTSILDAASTTSSMTLPDLNSATDGQFNAWQSQVFDHTAGASTFSFTYVVDGVPSDTWTNADSVSNPPSGSTGDITPVLDETTGVGYGTLEDAVNNATSSDTIELLADQTVSEEVTINKPLTIEGNGHTLFAPFATTGNDNNAALGIVGAAGDVTVDNLTVDGTGSSGIHDINIFDAGTVTLDGITVEHATKAGITVNGADAVVNNVTTSANAWGGINIDHAADATNATTTLTVTGTSTHNETGPAIWRDDNSKNVTFDDANNQYGSATYTSAPGVVGTIWGPKAMTVTTEAALRTALANPTVETITFGSDITLAAELDVTRAVTIDGAGHSLKASFSGASVLGIEANDVTVENLVEDGSGTSGNRGINIYKVTGIELDNVTAENNAKNGIVVNGSTVTVNNITTSGNGWEGIDVDMGSGVTTLASLTVNGTSVHNETKAAILIDDNTKVPTPTVIDTNDQYTASTTGTAVSYFLKDKNVKTATVTTDTSTGGGVMVTATIPSGAVISGDSSWDGTVSAPAATTVNLNFSGFNTSVSSAVAIGSSDSDLTFDKGVRLVFAGEAGQQVGWYDHAGTFTEITATCANDSQAAGDALAAGGSCKIDSGADLVVWTKHFSTFVTYVANPAASGSSGITGGGVAPSVTTSATTTASTPDISAGQVLGAAAYNFAADLFLGKSGADVTALQQLLLDAGFSIKAGATGYFGGQTKAAVIAYQKAHSLPQTGYVGPMTRAILNEGEITTTAESTATSTASSLTTAEKNAIVGLVQSFGADASVIASVKASLGL